MEQQSGHLREVELEMTASAAMPKARPAQINETAGERRDRGTALSGKPGDARDQAGGTEQRLPVS